VLTFVGSFGLFFTLYSLFVRFLPVVAIAEVRGVCHDAAAEPRGFDTAVEAARAVGHQKLHSPSEGGGSPAP